ncbi:putative beta-1,3-galactosyltransferase 12 [Tetrabaena socialis]|uniref:Hexosyltransferase n=1 Tax=Tetrabaena socialis TaxID=47790 RepID=A0A2J8A800_9CHLO|nr:putative beta-1,3-galactosyltransferase 12 [Tetrabaena socialis]|eukprot:PNH08656.1 putative beta-1,3-galactosyltransferase 12 [Tetrabaena socialis]
MHFRGIDGSGIGPRLRCCALAVVIALFLASGSAARRPARAVKGSSLGTWASHKYRARMMRDLQSRNAATPATIVASNLSIAAARLSSATLIGAVQVGPAAHAGVVEPKARSADQVRVFIGVMTAASPPGAAPYSKYDYQGRRQLLRRTWLSEVAQHGHMAARFVVGREPAARAGGAAGAAGAARTRVKQRKIARQQWAQLEAEARQHGDFLQLDVEDCYTCLTAKSQAFFKRVIEDYPSVEWIVKADDDVYVQPQRLLMAADQWAASKADLYVLSARVAKGVVARRQHALRPSGSCEDSAIGFYMLGSNARYLDDRRLCSLGCDNASVAVWDQREQGLAPGTALVLHDHPLCRTTPAWPLPYMLRRSGNAVEVKDEAGTRAREAAWARVRV